MLHWLKSGGEKKKPSLKPQTVALRPDRSPYGVCMSPFSIDMQMRGVFPVLYPAMLALPTQAEGEQASLATSRHQLELARSAGVS